MQKEIKFRNKTHTKKSYETGQIANHSLHKKCQRLKENAWDIEIDNIDDFPFCASNIVNNSILQINANLRIYLN